MSDEMYAWSTAVTGSFGWANGAEDDTWMSGAVKPTIETAAYLWDYGEHGQFRGVSRLRGSRDSTPRGTPSTSRS